MRADRFYQFPHLPAVAPDLLFSAVVRIPGSPGAETVSSAICGCLAGSGDFRHGSADLYSQVVPSATLDRAEL